MEIELLVQDSIQQLEVEFYKEKFYFSYSSLSKLLWNPQVFYQNYVLGIREEKPEGHLIEGKLIHTLMLEPEKLDTHYVLSNITLPSGSLKVLIDRIFKEYQDDKPELIEYHDRILEVMIEMNYWQALKDDSKVITTPGYLTGDQKRLAKVITSEATNYWNFLKTKKGKILIDQDTLTFCQNAVEIIKSDPSVKAALGGSPSDFDNVEIYNEFPIQIELDDYDFGLKGIVDNIVIDHDKKLVTINDLKTTRKDLKDFPETVQFYNYWIQAAAYVQLVVRHFKIPEDYDFIFNFIVVDRNYQTYVFPVSSATIKTWTKDFFNVLDKAEWHYKNHNFTLPYEFAMGKVYL